MSAWGWPQWGMAIVMAISLITGFSDNLRPWDTPAEKALDRLATIILIVFLLYAGGFWK